MTREHEPAKFQRTSAIFGLTEQEALYYRISERRFQQLLADETTQVHAVRLDSNSYGEFLFVTLSREVNSKTYGLTFYGLGFHEPREQWYTQQWYWYENHPMDGVYRQMLPKETAQQFIQERREDIASHLTDDPPSDRAVLFTLLADLTDEDGALNELDDLDFLWGGEE